MDDMIAKLKEFENHEDQFIVDTVNELIVLREGLNEGDLTQEQFSELVEDLLELQEVRKMSTTLERKTMLLKTLTTIKKIVEGGMMIT